MAFRKLLARMSTPVSELDRQQLQTFCTTRAGVVPIGGAQARADIRVVGEITSLRIVPRAGCPSLEAVIDDGSGRLTVVWTGRRQIAGITPGKRLVVSGRGMAQGSKGRLLLLNPSYELL